MCGRENAPAPVVGHLALSDGTGGTVEAHSAIRGVIRGVASGRRWDTGVLVPEVTYQDLAPVSVVPPTTKILRLTFPMMRGAAIRALQDSLRAAGFDPGRTDGVFGPRTQTAVIAFQAARGIVVDGEVGEETWRELGRPPGKTGAPRSRRASDGGRRSGRTAETRRSDHQC